MTTNMSSLMVKMGDTTNAINTHEPIVSTSHKFIYDYNTFSNKTTYRAGFDSMVKSVNWLFEKMMN